MSVSPLFWTAVVFYRSAGRVLDSAGDLIARSLRPKCLYRQEKSAGQTCPEATYGDNSPNSKRTQSRFSFHRSGHPSVSLNCLPGFALQRSAAFEVVAPLFGLVQELGIKKPELFMSYGIRVIDGQRLLVVSLGPGIIPNS